MPALGAVRIARRSRGATPAAAGSDGRGGGDATSLDNGAVRVEIDPETGDIAGLTALGRRSGQRSLVARRAPA